MPSIMIDTNVDIDAPKEAVWDVLIDFPSYSEWNPSMRIEGTPEVGKKLVVHLSRDGMTFKPEVLVATPNEELRWLGKLGFQGILAGEHFFVLTTNGDGTTRLNHGERFSGALVALARGSTKKTGRLDTKRSAWRSSSESNSSAKRDSRSTREGCSPLERVRPGCDLAPDRDTKSQDAQVAKALQNARFAPPALTPALPAIQLPHPARTLASASTQDTGLAHAISTSLTAGTAMLALALLVVVVLVRPRPARPATVAELALDRRDEELAA